jgi:sugar/nucleoside kinase (ribokinase family)
VSTAGEGSGERPVGKVPAYLSFGDLGIDSVALVDHLPKADEKIWVELVGDFPGGMMGNAAVTVATLGVSAGVIALLGEDERADLVIEDLKRHDVDHRFVRRIGSPTFWTLALTTPTGDRTLVQFPTSAFTADWEYYDRALVARTRWVHTTAEQGDPVQELLELARDGGTTTSVDIEFPFVQREDLPDLLALTDVAFLNRAAAETLGGVSAGARRAASMGPGIVVVTLGDEGCLLHDANGDDHLLPVYPAEPVDTNGAGDAFAGTFAAMTLIGLASKEAAEAANIVAAMSTRDLGGHGNPTTRDKLSELARDAGHEWWERLL